MAQFPNGTRVRFLASCTSDGVPAEEIGQTGSISGLRRKYDTGYSYWVVMDKPWLPSADITKPWSIRDINFEVIEAKQ